MKDKTAAKYGKQVERKNRELKWVKLGLMKVSSMVQRELRQSRVDHLARIMDPDKLGTPEVSFRDGHYYIMDGQHRIEAVKKYLGDGWQDQHIQCWVASGLTESDEAEVFLSLNDKLNLDNFQKFKIACRAGRKEEIEISWIVEKEDLVISKEETKGAIRAVGTLQRVFRRDGANALHRALAMARDSYGDPGLEAKVIDGFGLLCNRYNGVLDIAKAVESLSNTHGGVKGLLSAAEHLRQKSGQSKHQCVAAASVTIINRDRTGKDKLPSWWKE
jgi:hypothetical protein